MSVVFYFFRSDSQAASSHLVSENLEVTRTESVCVNNTVTREQSAALNQQMSTALHGKILSNVVYKSDLFN